MSRCIILLITDSLYKHNRTVGKDPDLEADCPPAFGGVFGIEFVRAHYNQIDIVCDRKIEYFVNSSSVKYLLFYGKAFPAVFGYEFIHFPAGADAKLPVEFLKVLGVGFFKGFDHMEQSNGSSDFPAPS